MLPETSIAKTTEISSPYVTLPSSPKSFAFSSSVVLAVALMI